ncbi:23S rRNA (adenine(2503)-C(2))-methyltransferase RlmN [Tenuifilum thalassicum]|uniref:Probable dual-specificity RNA methyltransferase RlmN n=1 Tax=Tenuifilum thalassicum TaxID=2590900 RepID=A0A7D4B9L2_9BACT|nr:23S rRNA (adenine(2503)-C(2))-methyltransferase RlmN [Tenuifilum thalassicum]QKG78740.1 23S rRNA (adenine(2503)-C(2))-methyltransferase RlmN [Tenuifilum thalassicum]
MVPLYGKTLEELKSIVLEEGLPAFSAKQITEWLYKHNAESIDAMTNLSKKAREQLSAKYTVGLVKPEKVTESADGTKKYLFPVLANRYVEAAYIPDKDRATLCVSSQSGCKMGCLFCMTAKQGFQGNLTAGEILNQLRSIPEFEKVTNIVYMGMGEPFDNLDNVLKSIQIMTSDWGMGWSSKRITVSTIGLIPAMKQFIESTSCHLAISLHTPFDDERKTLMPIQNVHPIVDVIAELKKYRFTDHRRVSFEYIMFDGLNDTPRHVKALVKLLNGLTCRINLIRFHPIPGSPLRTSPDERIIQFRDSLTSKGIFTTIRASRGQDIQAACGLLSTKALQEKGRQQ